MKLGERSLEQENHSREIRGTGLQESMLVISDQKIAFVTYFVSIKLYLWLTDGQQSAFIFTS